MYRIVPPSRILIDRDTIKITIGTTTADNFLKILVKEKINYKLSDEKPTLDQAVSNDYARKLIHGYYASISYIDHLIGQLLAELKALDLDKNTMIVLWGDHGWHLGNDRKWG